jgi:hypothetical protein
MILVIIKQAREEAFFKNHEKRRKYEEICIRNYINHNVDFGNQRDRSGSAGFEGGQSGSGKRLAEPGCPAAGKDG